MYLQLQSIFKHMNGSKTTVVHCIHKWQNMILCLEAGEKMKGIYICEFILNESFYSLLYTMYLHLWICSRN